MNRPCSVRRRADAHAQARTCILAYAHIFINQSHKLQFTCVLGGVAMRIQDHPILELKKGPRVKFTFNGQEVYGYEGESILAALHDAGVYVLSHSQKMHRPRGLFCAIGHCSSCSMRVNGVPNVRVFVESLREGMTVETQEGKGELA